MEIILLDWFKTLRPQVVEIDGIPFWQIGDTLYSSTDIVDMFHDNYKTYDTLRK